MLKSKWLPQINHQMRANSQIKINSWLSHSNKMISVFRKGISPKLLVPTYQKIINKLWQLQKNRLFKIQRMLQEFQFLHWLQTKPTKAFNRANKETQSQRKMLLKSTQTYNHQFTIKANHLLTLGEPPPPFPTRDWASTKRIWYYHSNWRLNSLPHPNKSRAKLKR